MTKSLLIVESPAKAKTIKRYLGDDFEVIASVGHIKDLPKNELGVDIADGFKPNYVTIQGKGKILANIKKMAKLVDTVYLAPDPDREGEAIAWHIAEEIGVFKGKAPKTYRVLINEITKKGVTEAVANPTEINRGRFESQQARRILDRLVGYQISPLLWDKVRRGLSAGRVQSVACRLVVDREREIQRFETMEYWTVKAKLAAAVEPKFWATLHFIDGKKAEIANEGEATAIVTSSKEGSWAVDEVVKRERKREPAAPFTTSKLQQEAARRLRFSAKLTMSVAQRLYEGIELGAEGAVGLISYMRTDSVRVSDDAIAACREYVEKQYGADALPKTPRVFKTKKGAQDAHEAIRPTNVALAPDDLKAHLSAEQYKLYKLIWQRFVASQMRPALFDQTRIDITNGHFTYRALGSILKYQGYQSVYAEVQGEDEEAKEEETLPDVKKGDVLKLQKLLPEQHFTQPPPRFTEATLVKELEERGIGRPSTYAAIISVIQEKGYAEKLKNRFHPTELGSIVTDLLVENFPRILDAEFTARMETDLDQIEEGTLKWVDLLQRFHKPFSETLEKARTGMRNLKREETPTDLDCKRCGAKMVIKWGRNGSFLACSAYPECKQSQEYRRDDDGNIIPVDEVVETRGTCPKCSQPLVVKTGRFGRFLACSGYPDCKHTEPLTLGVKCPKEDCEGELVEKRSKRGKTFYGCNKYPGCDYATWNRPLDVKCPTCQVANLEESSKRSATRWLCPNCGHDQPPADEAEALVHA
ncbi:MAG: DNA topoisomerase I [Deltaproteobacteria bacterium CG2_30_63_29]|nr:MAG: DNA topoisomerase I [Deltaproteobacteria bacterium CG2_30_63_29]